MRRVAPKVESRWPLFLGVLVFCLLFHAPGTWASVPGTAYSGEPVAMRVEFEIGSELRDVYWLAGLASTDGAVPDVLGLVWAPVSVGWFGSAWGLHLVSTHGLLPSNLAAQGSGVLAGMQYYTLASANPSPGHTYEAALSYDPASGAVAIRVGDVTEGRTLVERGLNLAPYGGPYYPTRHETEANITADVNRRFEPFGLTWRLVHLQPNGTMTPADPVDRRQPVHLHLQSPWDELSGAVRLRVDGEEVGRFEGVVNGSLFPVVLAGYASGTYEASLDYIHEGEVVSLGERTFHLGVVETRVEAVVHVTGPEEITVMGNLIVEADGPVSDASVSLDAVLSRVGLEERSYGTTYAFTSEPESVERLFEHSLPTLDATAENIPFAAVLNVSGVEWPYRIWELALVPEVSTGAGVRSTGFQDKVRVYAEGPPESDGTLRVMTYNIHHGEGADGQIDLQRLADVIAYSGADIIGLQEVDVRTRRSMGVDQIAVLAQLLRMESAFGSNLPYQGGNYGNGLLSRYPIQSSNNVSLYWAGGEPRGMLRAEVDAEGSPLTVFVTHLSLTAGENERQRQQIAGLLRKTDGHFVLLGDMNVDWEYDTAPLFDDAANDAWLQAIDMSDESSPLRRLTTLGSTFSSSRPTRRIDYIFLSDDLTVTGEGAVFTLESLASDHLPVVAEIEWKN